MLHTIEERQIGHVQWATNILLADGWQVLFCCAVWASQLQVSVLGSFVMGLWTSDVGLRDWRNVTDQMRDDCRLQTAL